MARRQVETAWAGTSAPVAANLGGTINLPFAIARLDFRERGDVGGADPFARPRFAEAKRVELNQQRHGALRYIGSNLKERFGLTTMH